MKSQRARIGTALAVLAAHNVSQNTVINERGYVMASLAATAGMVALGRDAGLGWEQMGLTTGDPKRTAGVAAASAVVGTTLVAAARATGTSTYMADARSPLGTRAEVVRRAATRFPLGTALFEEVAFRGVVPALLDDAGWNRPDAASAVLFGLWHLLPTHHALAVNEIGGNRWQRAGGVVAGSLAAALAGYGLGLIGRFTGSLLGPWVAHSSVNAGAYLASVLARSRS